MAKIIRMNQAAPAKKRGFVQATARKETSSSLNFKQFLQLQCTVYTIWRLEFLLLLFKSYLNKQYCRVKRVFLDKRQLLSITSFIKSTKRGQHSILAGSQSVAGLSLLKSSNDQIERPAESKTRPGKVIAFSGRMKLKYPG